ncbi:hypothetical protein GXW74_19905 [Roseomonas eburnea]|uniref:Lipoprotein n=1 Tax=Neoroseomonas eburnea TaxID=1346889 RepID=A0A9X9XGD1_9PROT|nr:hypothetical protein [Neoroseomonas eburnea]MBR0682767.1 hypothetical protein [Neoroseomonas eburnea]
MKLTMILAAMAVAVGGCQTPEERLAGYRDRCQREYGFTPGTDAFGNCLMQQENQRQRRIDAVLAAPAPVTPAPQPIFIPPVYVPR